MDFNGVRCINIGDMKIFNNVQFNKNVYRKMADTRPAATLIIGCLFYVKFRNYIIVLFMKSIIVAAGFIFAKSFSTRGLSPPYHDNLSP